MSSCRHGFAAFRVIALFVVATGCSRPDLVVGDGCTLNTDCAEPLVCGFNYCRKQCLDSRDCGAGLVCFPLGDGSGYGVCQLPDETDCALSSDCPSGLICSFGTCTTECMTDRDCVDTATCVSTDGVGACEEAILDLCLYNSDCPSPLVCWPDQACRFECLADRDCLDTELCVGNLCVPR